MCVISRESSHPSNTNVLMHLLPNGSILVCYLNTLSAEEPTMLMFPVNGKIVNVWEMNGKQMMQLDDYFTHHIDNHSFFNVFQDDDVTDGFPEGGTFETENYRGQWVPLDKEFYQRVNPEYYTDLTTFIQLTKSLVATKTDERDQLFVVCAQAKRALDRGNICVEYEFPVSGKVIIPGTLHEEPRAGKIYDKGDMNFLLTSNFLAKLEGDLRTQILNYVKAEECEGRYYKFVSTDGETASSTDCALLKHLDMSHLRDWRKRYQVRRVFKCVCEILSTTRKLRLGQDVVTSFDAGTPIVFTHFEGRKDNNFILE